MRSRTSIMLTSLVFALASASCGSDKVEVTSQGGAPVESVPTATPDPSSHTAGPPAPLSAARLAQLRVRGTTIEPLKQSDQPNTVSADEAVKAAASVFGFTAGRGPAEMGFGRVTSSEYKTKDPGSKVVRQVMADRLVWIVIFDQVPIPVHHPARVNPDQNRRAPREVLSDFVVYIDGNTGEYLGAGSIASADGTT